MVSPIGVLHTALPKVLYQEGRAVFMLGCNQPMNMIGHQHIRVNGAATFFSLLGQRIRIVDVIVFPQRDLRLDTIGPLRVTIDDVAQTPSREVT